MRKKTHTCLCFGAALRSEYFVLELRAAHTSGFKLRNSSSSSDNQRATKHLPGVLGCSMVNQFWLVVSFFSTFPIEMG